MDRALKESQGLCGDGGGVPESKQSPPPFPTIPRLLRDLSPSVLNSFFLLGVLEANCKQLHPSNL